MTGIFAADVEVYAYLLPVYSDLSQARTPKRVREMRTRHHSDGIRVGLWNIHRMVPNLSVVSVFGKRIVAYTTKTTQAVWMVCAALQWGYGYWSYSHNNQVVETEIDCCCYCC